MNIKRNIPILFTLCLCSFAVNSTAQSDSSFRFLKSVKGNFSSFNVDNLDNVYLITNTNQLKKINSNGDSVGVFNDVKRFGNPSSIDVTNPLKILLYYKNFSTVVILDRLLNIRNTINFRKQNIFLVKTIASSYDNNIWLFDEQESKLKKIDDGGNVLLETIDLRSILDSVPSPVSIIDHEGFVYVYDPQKGLFVFDYYGTFKNKLTFLNWQDVDVAGKMVYGFDSKNFYRYSIGSLNLQEYVLPPAFKDYISLKVMNGNLYLLKNNRLEIYSIH